MIRNAKIIVVGSQDDQTKHLVEEIERYRENLDFGNTFFRWYSGSEEDYPKITKFIEDNRIQDHLIYIDFKF